MTTPASMPRSQPGGVYGRPAGSLFAQLCRKAHGAWASRAGANDIARISRVLSSSIGLCLHETTLPVCVQCWAGSSQRRCSCGPASDHHKGAAVTSGRDLNSLACRRCTRAPDLTQRCSHRAPFLERMERTKRSVPGVRKWLRFEAGGRCGTLHADKYNITEETGVQVTSHPAPTACTWRASAGLHVAQGALSKADDYAERMVLAELAARYVEPPCADGRAALLCCVSRPRCTVVNMLAVVYTHRKLHAFHAHTIIHHHTHTC